MQNRFLAALAVGASFAVSVAHAALPTGAADIGPAVIVDMLAAAGFGAAVLTSGLGLVIGFDLLKKFIKKGAS